VSKLIVKSGGTTREIQLVKENFSIGRTPENDLEVKDTLISRKHSSIVRKGDRFVLYDLGSSNGTFVNRQKIEMKLLDNGDVIRIGDTEITYRDDKSKEPTRPTKPIVPAGPTAKREAPGVPGSPPGSRYIVQHVDDIAESYSINIGSQIGAGLSLKDARKEPQGERAAKESKMFFILFQVGRELTSAATLDKMLQRSIQLIFEIINADRGVMVLLDEHRALVPRIAYQRQRGFVPGEELPISSTILGQVVSEKVSVITPDAMQDSRLMAGQSIIAHNIRSALCVPLWEETKVYGAIYLDNIAKSYAFTRDDLDLLTAIANLIAIRIKQEDLHEKLRKEEILRANLSKYHSADVVEMLLTRGEDVGLEVQEREVTSLFIDVVGSTKLSEAIGPQDTAARLNEFFEMSTKAIFEHKGSVNKFIGDEVMAIYNAPILQADHALNAVRTAVRMIQDLDRHNREHPERKFDVRIGINTGPAVAGNVGTPTRMEYTVIGDSVNVAARLTKYKPEPNRIFVGQATWAKVKSQFEARDLGETALKGREKSMRVYEIVVQGVKVS
jgi:adenylate cyclase